MKILVIDTETTGLPERDASIYDFDKWPYIIQISYIMYDISNDNVIIKDNYVKINNSIEIPKESYEKHKLTHEILNDQGIHIVPALKEFNNLLRISDMVVAHNLSFDKRVIMVECLRNKVKQYFTTYYNNKPIRKPEFCTMRKTTGFCNIIRINKLQKEYCKTPSLIELYKILFPDANIPNDMHNSLVDILVTLKCYMKFNHKFDITQNKKINDLCVNFDIS
jgi:DNA polymerase III epsilon subunit-like protein